MVVQNNYWVRLYNFRRWTSCRSSCARVTSLHFHSHGVVEKWRKWLMEFTDELRELENTVDVIQLSPQGKPLRSLNKTSTFQCLRL